MKHIIIFFLLLTSTLSFAYDFEVNGVYYDFISITDMTVKAVDNGTYEGVVEIPDTVVYKNKSLVVVEIGRFHSKKMTGIILPNTLREIPDYAFDGTDIKEISIPNSVTKIGSWAFCRCENLVHANIPKSLEVIENGVFANCKKLNSIVIPSKVKTIKNDAFKNCSSMTSIIIEDSNDSLSIGAVDCDKYDKHGMFCTIFDYVYLGRNIDYSSSCYSAGGNGEYLECPPFRGIRELVIGDSVTTIPESVVSAYHELGYPVAGFFYYEYLTKLTIGKSLKNLPKCSNELKEIYCRSSIPPVAEVFDNKVLINAKLYIPNNTLEFYSSADNWKDFWEMEEYAVPDSQSCTVSVSASLGGSVSFAGNNISNSIYSTTVPIGESVIFDIKTEKGYIVHSATLNNEDVYDVVRPNGNIITINNVDSNIHLDVTFAFEPIYLSFKNAENGVISIVAERGRKYTTRVIPSEGWTIHTANFNGNDVTNDLIENTYITPQIEGDSEFIVVFESEEANLTKAIDIDSNVKVTAQRGCVIITNAYGSKTIEIYRTNGVCVLNEVLDVGTNTIKLKENNTYILKINNNVYKVAL